MLNRRSVIKALAAMAGALLLPLDRLAGDSIAPTARAQVSGEGELYGGFILLPEGTTTPSIVKAAKRGIPKFSGAGGAITTPLGSARELASKARLPVYSLKRLPPGLRPAGAALVQHPDGETYGGWVAFESFNDQIAAWECTVDIWAQPDYRRPFPLWSANAVEPGGPAVVLQKVDFLPSPGIAVPSEIGLLFYWIARDVLYVLRAEQGPSRQDAEALASALTLVA